MKDEQKMNITDHEENSYLIPSELMIRRIYPYTRIFVRIFGEYSILPSQEYAAKTLL